MGVRNSKSGAKSRCVFFFLEHHLLCQRTLSNVFRCQQHIDLYLWPVEYDRGGLPYERDGDARRKIRIKTLKETNLGVAQAFFDP